jgi:hypothetical protein
VRGRKAIRAIELRASEWVRNIFVAPAAQSRAGIVPRRDTDGARRYAVPKAASEAKATATKSKINAKEMARA